MHTIGAEDRFVFRIAILPWPPHIYIYTERHRLRDSRAQDGDEYGHFCFLLRQTFGCECERERLSAHSQIDWWVICATLDENTFYLIVATFHFVLGRCWRRVWEMVKEEKDGFIRFTSSRMCAAAIFCPLWQWLWSYSSGMWMAQNRLDSVSFQMDFVVGRRFAGRLIDDTYLGVMHAVLCRCSS